MSFSGRKRRNMIWSRAEARVYNIKFNRRKGNTIFVGIFTVRVQLSIKLVMSEDKATLKYLLWLELEPSCECMGELPSRQRSQPPFPLSILIETSSIVASSTIRLRPLLPVLGRRYVCRHALELEARQHVNYLTLSIVLICRI